MQHISFSGPRSKLWFLLNLTVSLAYLAISLYGVPRLHALALRFEVPGESAVDIPFVLGLFAAFMVAGGVILVIEVLRDQRGLWGRRKG